MTRTLLTAVALVALTTGCAQRQKTAGERMLNVPPAQPTAVAQAPVAPPVVDTPTPAAPATPVTPAVPATVSTQPAPGVTTAAAVPPVDPSQLAPDADQAARLRGWNRTTALYQNGNVIAGPVYRYLPPAPRSNRPADVQFSDFAQTALAVPQFIATPFWMLITPTQLEVLYTGEQFAPSYTLDDPIDQSRVKTRGIHRIWK
ncbi:MAG: hypothetical protein ACAI43_15780 [Phycisphaerae bacterium]